MTNVEKAEIIIAECQSELEKVLGRPVKLTFRFDAEHYQTNLDFLKETICDTFKVSWKDICGIKKPTEIKIARHFFCHFAKIYLKIGCSKIGKLISKNHATVLHAWETIDDDLSTNDESTVEYNKILCQKLGISL